MTLFSDKTDLFLTGIRGKRFVELARKLPLSWLLGIFSVFSLSYIYAQSLKYYPVVFGDEFTYNWYSRLDSLTDAAYPNYLYFTIFGASDLCGPGYLSCVKLLNVACYGIGAYFVYKTSRLFLSQLFGSIILLLTIYWPTNRYSIYFMPESAYFMGFWIFIYLLFRAKDRKTLDWVFLGATYGLVALIKPHAIFLLPALIVFILFFYSTKQEGFKNNLQTSFKSAVIFLGSFFFVKFGLGYVFAGKSGLTFFGYGYESHADSQLSTDFFNKLIDSYLPVSSGHIISLIFLFGLSLFVLVYSIVFPKKLKHELGTKIWSFHVFILLLLVSSIVFVTAFTISIAQEGSAEGLNRLHQRYYSFLFPLLFIVIGIAIKSKLLFTFKIRLFVAIIGSIFYFFSGQLLSMYPNNNGWIDSPEIAGATSSSSSSTLLVLALVTLLIWTFYPLIGYVSFLSVFLFAVAFSGTANVDRNLEYHTKPDTYTQAGLLTRNHLSYISPDSLNRVAVFGSDYLGLRKTLFQIGNINATPYLVNENDEIDLSSLPDDKEWIIVVGDLKTRGAAFSVFTLPDFKVMRRAVPTKISFKGEIASALPFAFEGLSQPEAWGTWSSSKFVTFKFTEELPQYFNLKIVAQAFGPNVGKNVSVTLGTDKKFFKLTGVAATRKIEFINSTKSNTLVFEIPLPTSPNSIVDSPDLRELGVGFHSITIEPKDK